MNIRTIDSDDEIETEKDLDSEEENEVFHLSFDDGEYSSKLFAKKTKQHQQGSKLRQQKKGDEDDGNDDYVRAMPHSEERIIRERVKQQKRGSKEQQAFVNKRKGATTIVDEEEEEEEEGESENDDDDEEEEEDQPQNGMSAREEASYFDSVVNAQGQDGLHHAQHQDQRSFTELSLSRSLLRGIEAAGYTTPTPVQSSVIPLALAGRDVCASAVTGSGKTAAFLLPCLERLLHRNRESAAIRVLVITPTRELATQIYTVLQQLSTYTDITSVLICGGGKDVRSQEATLRLRPDVVICTPGRFLDHLRNSRSVNVDDLDVLILDEVDRLLDLGFQEEVEELVKQCPQGRQTLLFSATLTSKVEDLVKLSLKRPVRVKTSLAPTALAPRLVQEFVKVRVDEEREAILVSLITRSFHEKTIVFCETKKETHRVYLLLKLLDVRVAQLHGDMTQAQRYQSLEHFRTGQVHVLVATDVAARGLDIAGVMNVVNAEMPRNHSTYIHRVGRTARAGSSGRAITLVTDSRRKLVKEMLKADAALMSEKNNNKNNDDDDNGNGFKGRVLSRSVSAAVIDEFVTKIARLEVEVVRLIKEEKLESQMREAQAEVDRAENMLVHEAEIQARPARTWYQSETDKQARKDMTRQQVVEERNALLAGHSDKLNAVEKRNAIAEADDYRLEEDDGKSDGHRLSRKKKRRMLALRDIERDRNESRNNNDDDDDDDDDGDDNKNKGNHQPLKRPKFAKTPINAKSAGTNKHAKTITEIAETQEVKKRSRMQLTGQVDKQSTRDLMRPRIAVGGLDQDVMFASLTGEGLREGGISKKKLKAMQRKTDAELEFEVDPNKKLRKGGKISHHAFKSKSKFKRR